MRCVIYSLRVILVSVDTSSSFWMPQCNVPPVGTYLTATCSGGNCGVECAYPELSFCGAYCAYLPTDVDNCGACGNGVRSISMIFVVDSNAPRPSPTAS